jgi:hypothetical protein
VKKARLAAAKHT